jgi:hypothetical protein
VLPGLVFGILADRAIRKPSPHTYLLAIGGDRTTCRRQRRLIRRSRNAPSIPLTSPALRTVSVHCPKTSCRRRQPPTRAVQHGVTQRHRARGALRAPTSNGRGAHRRATPVPFAACFSCWVPATTCCRRHSGRFTLTYNGISHLCNANTSAPRMCPDSSANA